MSVFNPYDSTAWPASEFAPCERMARHIKTQKHLPRECPVLSAADGNEWRRNMVRLSDDYRGLCTQGREYFFAGREDLHLDDWSTCLDLDLADELQRVADETDDARDHDELHAAADVVRAHMHSRYIDRWVDELRKRWVE